MRNLRKKLLTSLVMWILHLTKISLGKKLRHLTIDGVYVDPSERIRGGGGLGIVNHLEEFLNLSPGTITATWDSGHKIQLVFGDVFQGDNGDPHFKKLVNDMYSMMSTYSHSKLDSLHFKEIAEELGHPVLKNQGAPQRTRWVRSFLCGVQAFCRNSPTIYNIIGRDIEKFAAQRDLTKQKEAEKKLN